MSRTKQVARKNKTPKAASSNNPPNPAKAAKAARRALQKAKSQVENQEGEAGSTSVKNNTNESSPRQRFTPRPEKDVHLDHEYLDNVTSDSTIDSMITKVKENEKLTFSCFRCNQVRVSQLHFDWNTSEGIKTVCNGCYGYMKQQYLIKQKALTNDNTNADNNNTNDVTNLVNNMELNEDAVDDENNNNDNNNEDGNSNMDEDESV
eukprot:gene7418-10110_t